MLEEVGAIFFLALGFFGIGTAFFFNLFANSPGVLFGQSVPLGPNGGALSTAGTLPWMNIAVGLKVMTGLTSVVIAMLVGGRKEERE
jgi:multicomponent Na+:H+ antiporter subunit B